MKTQLSTIKKVTMAVAFFGLLLTGKIVNAAGNPGNEIDLVFLGNEANLPVFRLDLSGKSNDVYAVTIKANDGTILYSEKVKSDRSARFYKLDPDYNDQVKGTSFEILNINTGKAVYYKIDTNSKTTETVSLVKS